MGPEVPLCTSRWAKVAAFERQLLKPAFVPVRTSVGLPRFLREAKRFPAVHELMPYGLLKIEDGREFDSRYIDKLERAGPEVIHARFVEIWDLYAAPLVLLCYEDVHAGQACHRRTFADWWHWKTGQKVPELDELPVATEEEA